MSHLYNHIQRHTDDAPVTELHRGESETSSKDASTISEITLEQGLKPPPDSMLPSTTSDDMEDVPPEAMLKADPEDPEVGLKEDPEIGLKDPPPPQSPPQRAASVGEEQQPEQSEQYDVGSATMSEDSSAKAEASAVMSLQYSEISSTNESLPVLESLAPSVAPIREEDQNRGTTPHHDDDKEVASEVAPPRNDRKYKWYIGIAVVVAIIAIVVAVVVVVVTRDSGGGGGGATMGNTGGGSPQDLSPTEPPDTTGPTISPTPSPTTSDPTTIFPTTNGPTTSGASTDQVEAFLISKAFDGGEALTTPGTPQNRAYEWLLEDRLNIEGSYNTLQRYALATLYYATGGDTSWLVDDLWLSLNEHVCEWNNTISRDQRCSDSGEDLLGLSLPNNQLTGSLPRELALADQFIFLEFFLNQLKGTIPVEYFTSMPNLFFINFYFNDISGSLPTEIGLATALSYVDLDSNKLIGNIPTELGLLSQMETLWLNYNNFTGTIPTELGNLVLLEQLYLEGNGLNGTVPDELCNLPALSVLKVGCDVVCTCCADECEASGPEAEALLTSLAAIAFDGGAALATKDSPQWKAFNWLGNRQTLPSISDDDRVLLYSLATFYYATTVEKWVNATGWLRNDDPCTWFGTDGSGCTSEGVFVELHLREDNLVGSLPAELAHVTTLRRIDLKKNSLLFTIPVEYFTNLQLLSLDVFNNFLTGALPTELGLQTTLEYIDIDSNSFQTTLPTEMGLLSSVEIMWLNNNLFSGTIPTELLQLPKLSELYLTGNSFDGDIPLGLCDLTLLEKLEGDCNLPCACCTNECEVGVTRPPMTTLAPVPSPTGATTSSPIAPTPDTSGPSPTGPTTNSPTDLSMVRIMDVLTIASFDGGTSLAVDGTPQNQAFNWLLRTDDVSVLSDERLIQRYALATLYYSTNGPGWDKRGGFLTDDDECDWISGDDGAPICSGGKLISLDLDSNKLAGPIPAEIGLLSNLLEIDFFNNDLTGTIPKEIGRLTDLTTVCDFDSNILTGAIPTEFGNLKKLTTVWLNDNELSSTVPTELGLMESLDQLYIHENDDIFGTVPAELCALEATTIQVDCDTLACTCCQPSCVP